MVNTAARLSLRCLPRGLGREGAVSLVLQVVEALSERTDAEDQSVLLQALSTMQVRAHANPPCPSEQSRDRTPEAPVLLARRPCCLATPTAPVL